ncbi:MAG: hypothetical protein JO097_08195 [Acidobacteriaceae bacterium]|nr:hypothetical protein [Acidobacteriaceae bacterium]
MSLQVFLQAQLLGAEDFLASPPPVEHDDMADLCGRCAWLNLICEVLPRALLSELRLSRMLLGSSSAEQFLVVLTAEDITRATEFLNLAAQAIAALSHGSLRLIWATTEDLGAWPVARKRLDDALSAKAATPISDVTDASALFLPSLPGRDDHDASYFANFAASLPSASKVGWSRDQPAHLTWDEGQYSWPLKEQSRADEDAILFPRRFALDDAEGKPSSLGELASRADGTPRWGVLRGDVDQFHALLRSAASIEDHIHLSALYKEFFAGELALLCTLPDFWRKVTILYRGGDDFAVIGAWDALVTMAREIQRLYEKFTEQTAPSAAGLEGKNISMALSIAPETGASPTAVFRDAGVQLRSAKAAEAGTFYLFGRAIEWKRLRDAEELKANLLRLVRNFGYSPQCINDLASVYREAYSARAARRGKPVPADKPWRTHLRLSRVIPPSRGKDINNLRSAVIASLSGKKTAGVKLRPSARVGVEWARLAAGQ